MSDGVVRGRGYSRRRVIGTLAAGALTGAAGAQEAALPVTGEADGRLARFDEMMRAFVAERKVPGAALAVSRQGRLVYARGFGYADVEARQPVEPGARFRIASISKPLTAVAVLQLVEQGKVGLEDQILDHLHYTPHLEPGATPDPRWKRITVRQLLQHTGGWDRNQSFDPIGRPREILQALKAGPPLTPELLIRYMLGKPLDFDPGTRYAYSNLGYLLLGRLIEKVSGLPYERYVRERVLAPLGISDVQLGRALLSQRAPGEVRHYDALNRTAPAVLGPEFGRPVPLPYGGANLDGYEAHGGWIASAPSLVRFAAAFDVPARCPVLKEQTIRTMWARPEGAAGQEADGKPKDVWYGCGWSVRRVGADGRVNAWHTGLIAGTSTLLVRRFDGLDWAVLFNTQQDPEKRTLSGLIDPLVHQAAAKVREWPEKDLFPRYVRVR